MTSGDSPTIRICYLYPRLLSVAGDRGNLFALMQRCAWRGIRYSVTEADVGVVPDFAQCDLILLHGGQDREMTVAARDLAAKGGPLREAIEAGAVVMAVCAGYQLLGQCYAPVDGPPIPGLGVLDAVTEGGPTRFIGHVTVECDLGSGAKRPAYRVREPQRAYLPGQRRRAARAGARRGRQQRGGRHRGRPLPGGVRHLSARAGAAQESVAGRPPALPGAGPPLHRFRPACPAHGPGGGACARCRAAARPAPGGEVAGGRRPPCPGSGGHCGGRPGRAAAARPASKGTAWTSR